MNTTATATIDRKLFARTLTRLGDTIRKNNRKPILSHCRIEINGAVSLFGIDPGCEQTATENVDDITVDKAGDDSRAVSFDSLRKIVRSLKTENVTIAMVDDDGATINGLTLPTMSCDEMPAISCDDTAETAISGESSELARMINDTLFACDIDSSRYALGGVLVEIDDDVTLVGSDGRRLATSATSLLHVHEVTQLHDDDVSPVIIPALAAKTFLKALKSSKGQFSLLVFKNHVQLVVSGSTITARRLEGRFPKWKDVIPTSNGKKMTFNADELLADIHLAATYVTAESRGIDFAFRAESCEVVSPDGKSVVRTLEPFQVSEWFDVACFPISELPTRVKDYGKNTELYDSVRNDSGQLTAYNGSKSLPSKWQLTDGIIAYPTVVTTFDHRYLEQYLKTLPKDAQVTIAMENGNAAFLLSAVNSRSSYVLMPLARDRK